MKGRNLMVVRRASGGMIRFCRSCRDAARGAKPITPEIMNRIKEALERGASIGEITKGFPTGGGPVDRRLYICEHERMLRQRKIDPEFDSLIKKHMAASISVGLALHHAKDLPPEFKPTIIAVARLKHRIKTIGTA
jgi:hypothetical protein